MRCFYHPDKEAVALCVSCVKGICVDCAAVVQHAQACRSRCEERARLIFEVWDHNIQAMAKLSRPKVEVVSPDTEIQPNVYSTAHLAAQLTRHVHNTHQFQRVSGRFYLLIGGFLLIVAIV